MINSKHLEELERLGFGSDISALESYIALLQEAAADGEPLVDNPVYDQHTKLLRVLKPDSELLNRNWEKDGDEPLRDYDELLVQYGMRSIKSCTEPEEFYKYFARLSGRGKYNVDLFVSYKMNGHASRVVYRYGELVSGTPRGRYKKGRDITRHFRQILPNHIEYFEAFPLVEIRGELIVSYNTFSEYLSRTLKNPLSSVTSLVRDSASNEEIRHLEFIAYKILIKTDEGLGAETFLGTLSEEFSYLEACGFKVPTYKLYHGVELEDPDSFLDTILDTFSDDDMLMGYDTDGLVVCLNSSEDFYELGTEGNHFSGNAAVKMGIWECNKYSGIIEEIVWERGKKWFTPKARIKSVTTADGKSVTTVPLYNVGVLIKLGLKRGKEINFRFGGETGVQLLTPDGQSVTCLD